MNCTIRAAKTKALISFAVIAKLICAFVFAYAYCWFSHEAAHIFNYSNAKGNITSTYTMNMYFVGYQLGLGIEEILSVRLKLLHCQFDDYVYKIYVLYCARSFICSCVAFDV